MKLEDIQKHTLIRIVDDDTDLLEATELMLTFSGWRVKCYASASEFLAGDAPSDPGCLILDIRMPDMTAFRFQHDAHLQSFGRSGFAEPENQIHQPPFDPVRQLLFHDNQKVDIALFPPETAECDRPVQIDSRQILSQHMPAPGFDFRQQARERTGIHNKEARLSRSTQRVDEIHDLLRSGNTDHHDFGSARRRRADRHIAEPEQALKHSLRHGGAPHVLDPDFMLLLGQPAARNDDTPVRYRI